MSRTPEPYGSPCADNHCSTRYEQSFRHNKHTHTNQKAATDKHSRHNHKVYRKLHQGILSPTLFNIYTSDSPSPRAPVQVMAYADDITITSTHTIKSAAKKCIQPYLYTVFAWTKQTNLTLNPDKTTCTLFTPDPTESTNNLDLKINNTSLHMATQPKFLGRTLDPKLTYSTHIYNLSVHTHKPLQIIKALTTTR